LTFDPGHDTRVLIQAETCTAYKAPA